jgi:uncharacterized protein YjcR
MGAKEDIAELKKRVDVLERKQEKDDEKFISLHRKYDRAVDLLNSLNTFGKWAIGIIIALYTTMKVLTNLDL